MNINLLSRFQMKSIILCWSLVSILLTLSAINARQAYQALIPNGQVVPDHCATNSTWPGVGHVAKAGGGTRNAFGIAFDNANRVSVSIIFVIHAVRSLHIAFIKTKSNHILLPCLYKTSK